MGRLAAVQHGLVTYGQVIGEGVPSQTLSDWLEAGRLERVQPRVYRLAGAPPTWEQEAMAAVLCTGGVASHRTAARFWALGDYGEVEVTVPRSRRGRAAGVIVHRSGDLQRGFVTRRAGVPVTNPMRTLVDLGAVLDRAYVEEALEQALVAKVCSVLAVEKALHHVARKGRAGAGVLRGVLDDRALGQARPDGLLEVRMARVLREHGLPRARYQYEVRVGGRLVARVDFAYPEVLLAIEVDGFSVHGTPRAFQADLERQNRLVAAGWTVLRFTWLDVVRRPEWVVAQIRAVLEGLSQAA
jgi:very-short-patch-repair endonuclease